MKFTNLKNGSFKLNDDVVDRMLGYVQDERSKLEAGGVILGRFIKGSDHVIVDKITVPMVGDIRKRYSFTRSEKGHQRLIESNWKKSNGTCNYLGEWHTHPEWYPEPSEQDYKNWKTILSSRTFDSDELYFVIVGIVKTRVWEGNRKTKKIKRIR